MARLRGAHAEPEYAVSAWWASPGLFGKSHYGKFYPLRSEGAPGPEPTRLLGVNALDKARDWIDAQAGTELRHLGEQGDAQRGAAPAIDVRNGLVVNYICGDRSFVRIPASKVKRARSVRPSGELDILDTHAARQDDPPGKAKRASNNKPGALQASSLLRRMRSRCCLMPARPVLAIVTDAWRPQVNGVVTTLERTIECIEKDGIRVEMVHPGAGFLTVPCPSYPSIRLAAFPWAGVRKALRQLAPDAIHISTEGPLGMAARQYCVAHGLRFTTSYHTQYPRYLRSRWPIPERLTYAFLRRFHGAATRTMVATASMKSELEAQGFSNLALWGRGVDCERFRPQPKGFLGLPRPISIYVGRLAVEKNIEAFLDLELPGTKVVVGDGPAAPRLKLRYPQAKFTGMLAGTELARYVADADVFVFPSRTDTFGVVMLEAMACGVPVAAYPAPGPVDVVRSGKTGVLHEDLATAVHAALRLDGHSCREHALTQSWQAASGQFAGNLVAACGDSLQVFTAPSTLEPA